MHYEKYSYASTNINGIQNELFVHHYINNNQNLKKFIANKYQDGVKIGTVAGTKKNNQQWIINNGSSRMYKKWLIN